MGRTLLAWYQTDRLERLLWGVRGPTGEPLWVSARVAVKLLAGPLVKVTGDNVR